MSIDTTMVQGGGVQFPDVITNLGTVFNDASLANGDGLQEIDLSGYVPKGCRCAICTIYLHYSADGRYLIGYSTDGSNSRIWCGIRAADDGGVSVNYLWTGLCPLDSNRTFWVEAMHDTMAVAIYLRGWLEP